MCCRGRISDALPQCSQAIVDQGFRPGVCIGDASGSFPVGQQVFLCLRSLAFEVLCFLPRPPCFDTNRLMSCTAVTDLPEGTACHFDCRFLRGPTVGEFSGSGDQVFAGAIQFVLQTILVFLGSFELVSRLCDCCIQHISLFVFKRHLFSWRPRSFRTPPPKYPGPVLSSGSCRGPCRSLHHSCCRWR